MRSAILLLSFFLFFTSCNDNTEKVAEGMCDCYGKSAVKFSSTTKKLLGILTDSKNPVKTFQDEIAKLEGEERTLVSDEIQQASVASNEPELKDCAAKVDKKYKVHAKDQNDALRKVMQHMAEKGGSCKAWAGLMNLGLQANEKSTNSGSTSRKEDGNQ